MEKIKYIKSYDSKVKRPKRVFQYKNCKWEFPLYLTFESKDYYGKHQERNVSIDDFYFSDNLIWGDETVTFFRTWTEPHYDYVTERSEKYCLNEFLRLIERHNEYTEKNPKTNWGDCRIKYDHPTKQRITACHP